jgi:VanZ family protein
VPSITSPADPVRRAARRKARVRNLAWVGLALALLLFLAFGDSPERTRFWDAFFDAGHVPLFGLLSLAALALVRSCRSGLSVARAGWVAFAITVGLGTITEVLQLAQPSRDPSLVDLSRDVAGAGAFLLVAVAWSRGGEVATRPGGSERALALTVAVALLVGANVELGRTVAMYAMRDRAFPTLFALDGSWWEGPLIRAGEARVSPRAHPATSSDPGAGPLARIDLEPGDYPGLTFDEPYPDWRGCRSLEFVVVSESEGRLPLTIRVHDALHDHRYRDRFNRAFWIVRGANPISIPLDDIRRAPDRREMDMARIRGIVIFSAHLAEPAHLFIGPLRLR